MRIKRGRASVQVKLVRQRHTRSRVAIAANSAHAEHVVGLDPPRIPCSRWSGRWTTTRQLQVIGYAAECSALAMISWSRASSMPSRWCTAKG
jgi:hypothetical protein